MTADAWWAHLEAGAEPFLGYMFDRLDEGGDRHNVVKLLRAADLFNPKVASSTNNVKAMRLIEDLGVYAAVTPTMIEGLKAEWAADYKEKFIGVDRSVDVLTWHYDHRNDIGAVGRAKKAASLLEQKESWWWDVAALLVLVQPTSASAERLFSLLNAYFGQRRSGCLADVIRATLMLVQNGEHT